MEIAVRPKSCTFSIANCVIKRGATQESYKHFFCIKLIFHETLGVAKQIIVVLTSVFSPKLKTDNCPLSSKVSALEISDTLSKASSLDWLSAMLDESSMASTIWYSLLEGLVRRSQILSLRNWEAMYGITLRMLMRLPVR